MSVPRLFFLRGFRSFSSTPIAANHSAKWRHGSEECCTEGPTVCSNTITNELAADASTAYR